MEVARKASMERVFGAPAVTSMERVFGAPAVTRHGLPSRLRPAVACLKFRRGAPIGGTVTSELTASSESLAPGWGRNRLGVFHRPIQPGQAPNGVQIRPGVGSCVAARLQSARRGDKQCARLSRAGDRFFGIDFFLQR